MDTYPERGNAHDGNMSSFHYAAVCLAQAAESLSNAAQAMSMAAEAFSAASSEPQIAQSFPEPSRAATTAPDEVAIQEQKFANRDEYNRIDPSELQSKDQETETEEAASDDHDYYLSGEEISLCVRISKPMLFLKTKTKTIYTLC
jgi:hypothetical protein